MEQQMLVPHVPLLNCGHPYSNSCPEARYSMTHANRPTLINLPVMDGLSCRSPILRSPSRSPFRSEDAPLCSRVLPDVPASQPNIPPRPPSPRPWVWICHFCRNKWPLGTTRRCLYDGHYYCAGQRAANLKRKRGPIIFSDNACTSEFDYPRWADMTKWQRKVRNAEHKTRITAPLTLSNNRNCWDQCSFPSACRIIRTWGISESRMAEDSSSEEEDASEEARNAKRRKIMDVIHHAA
jgi:hypothetical protein